MHQNFPMLLKKDRHKLTELDGPLDLPSRSQQSKKSELAQAITKKKAAKSETSQTITKQNGTKSEPSPAITKKKAAKSDKNKINVTLIQVGKSCAVQVQKRATKLNRKNLAAALACLPSSSSTMTGALAASSSPAVQAMHRSSLNLASHLLQPNSFPLDERISSGIDGIKSNSNIMGSNGESRLKNEPFKKLSSLAETDSVQTNSALSKIKLDTVFVKSSSAKKRNKKRVHSGVTEKNEEDSLKTITKQGSNNSTHKSNQIQESNNSPSITNYTAFLPENNIVNDNVFLESRSAQHSINSNTSLHHSSSNQLVNPYISNQKSKGKIELLNNSEEHAYPLNTASKKKKKKLTAKEQKTRAIQKEIDDIRLQNRHQKFNNELEAYLSVCVSVGMVNRAFNTLSHYTHAKKLPLTSVSIFNTVMLGYYNCGHWQRVPLVKSWLHNAGLSPDATMHALHIAALHNMATSRSAPSHSQFREDSPAGSRSGPPGGYNSSYSSSNFVSQCLASVYSHYGIDSSVAGDEIAKEQITLVVQEMTDQGMSLDQMFGDADFVYNLSHDALCGVRRLYPDYTPSSTKILDSPGYDCALMSALNTRHDYGLTRETALSLASPADCSSPYYASPETIEEQFALEVQGEVPIPSIHSGATQDPNLKKTLEVWKGRWRQALLTALTSQLETMRKTFFARDVDKLINIFPYLLSVPPEQLVSLMLQELGTIASVSEGSANSSHYVAHRLSRRVYSLFVTRYKTEAGVVDKLKKVYKRYAELYAQHAPSGANTRVLFEQLAQLHYEGPRIDHRPPSWPYSLHIELGRFLYGLMIKNVFVWHPLNSERCMFPALREVDLNVGYRNILHIKPHAALLQLYRQSDILFFFPTEMPMLCPPLPWMSNSLGANLLLPVPMVRMPPNVHCSLHNQRLQESALSRQLNPCMDSLNQLAQVPWHVNPQMLDVIMEVFNSNSGPNLDVPQHPSVLARPSLTVVPALEEGKEAFKKHKAKFNDQLQLYYKTKNEMHSLWCTALYKISMAYHYRDRVFWLPHNLDFRGRAYPCSPHLCHFDSDLFRSMLHFAQTKPLGQDGLDWLKIHVINLTGFKKTETLAERLRYCDEMLPEIFDSAVHPLTGRRWWTKSDEPWQTLAACKELYAALQSPDPLSFESRLPVHQDGSCNGLQHYAALGRDTEGAISVNLAPCHIKQDVYSDVARLVEKRRVQDAADSSSADHRVACALQDRVKRKVVKQTIMTTVYGVTQFGARLQIQKQLKDLDGFPPELVKEASRYLASSTFHALETMFVSTKHIQDWFTLCARLISTVCGQGVEWVTPLGLPIVQPYYKPSTKHKLLKIGNTIPLKKLPDLQLPNSLKQCNAFPPNFIHSLDACHMMLTALHSHHAGLTFASVHDCYWTHASTVDLMSKICRDQFVSLHSQPIVTDLSQFLFDRFGFQSSHFTHDGSTADSAKLQVNHALRAVPKLGQFDIDLVKKSTFFFS